MDKVKQLAQYTAVCSPDFSLYPEMPLPVQEFQVFKNRWCGAHWQTLGLHVFPTVTWGDERSYSFCFAGIKKHSSVVVSTVGCRTSPNEFLRGYNRMLEVIHPETIICYGTPFTDMEGNIISFPYATFRKEASFRRQRWGSTIPNPAGISSETTGKRTMDTACLSKAWSRF